MQIKTKQRQMPYKYMYLHLFQFNTMVTMALNRSLSDYSVQRHLIASVTVVNRSISSSVVKEFRDGLRTLSTSSFCECRYNRDNLLKLHSQSLSTNQKCFVNYSAEKQQSWNRTRHHKSQKPLELNILQYFSSSSPNVNYENDKLKKRKRKESTAIPTPSTPSTSDTINIPTKTPSIVPGLVLSGAVALLGESGAKLITLSTGIPLSSIPVSILLGIVIRNNTFIPISSSEFDSQYKEGVTTATKTILQIGIVCVGAKLSLLNDVFLTGSSTLPIVIGSVTAGFLWIPFAGKHIAGLSSELSKLLAIGTSICGVTAITALAPAINAPSRDVTIAVANTVAFGTIGMLTYPYLFHYYGIEYLNLTSEQIGTCLGIGIHDTSQVLGAAMAYNQTYDDPTVLKVAAVTKLLRNLGLALAIPILTYAHHKEKQQTKVSDASVINDNLNTDIKPATISGLNTFTQYVPPFVVAFVGMSAFRSFGDYMLLSSALIESDNIVQLSDYYGTSFKLLMDTIGNDGSKYALGIAMAGVGLSTTTSSLKGVGWKPFAVGLSGTIVVAGTGISLATFLI